tara:strand:- start:880 stop:1806 length:927 start_codon:yes stop_codon:yes gene_type:complete
MEKIEFKCPNCESENSLILMGHDKAEFGRKCLRCKIDLDITKTEKGLEIKLKAKRQKSAKRQSASQTLTEEENKARGKVPADYKVYSSNESDNKTALIIAILILTSSLMGISTGWSLTNAFELDYGDYERINLEIIVQNNTSDLENVTIIFNNKEMNYTYEENGSYKILIIPGKYNVKIIAPEHKNATMEFFVPPQDSNLRLPDTNEGIEGINRFTFIMEEGTGSVNLEENVYIKIFSWCPNLVYAFSLIGIWGAFVTYKRQSYKNAQIGAFFSVMAMGFLIIGPILGIIALYYLKKHKNIFTASFKN